MIEVPAHWYNVLADRRIELSKERSAGMTGTRPPQVPKSLVRQSMPLRTWDPIPEPVLAAYREWRPTPLRRAHNLERAIGAKTPLYYKYEAGNVAGSHKYLTALAQAYYYSRAGVETLVTSTAAGQWGTAVAAAAQRFGLRCRIYMVPRSYDRKPGRRTVMELLGAEVIRANASQGRRTSLVDAMTEAVSTTASIPGSRWILGGSEPFAILHCTVIGLETKQQLAEQGETAAPVLVGYLGGAKNIGGLGLPFLQNGGEPRIVLVESSSYPVLTRGMFAFDSTDETGASPQAGMFTLGSRFRGAPIQAEGIRYHAAPKLASELYRRGLLAAVAHDERPVFDSARKLLTTEGILVSAEAAYAVHEACRQACDSVNAGRPVVFCLTDHGSYDTDAWRAYLDDELHTDAAPTNEEITAMTAGLTPVH
ncbi:pyridoxal-phosphate dependent enzyme [Kibdelosporangium aridum]|uniref:pyridoxal-phosphate dependent enzyme n=1 Tax=Kibdelosporangium aridum TaxID=2030 RepID=UPI0035E93564